MLLCTRHFRMATLFCLAICVTALSAVGATGQDATEGLDSLGEDRLINELATRGLGNLLERAFEIDQVPAERRGGLGGLMGLKGLGEGETQLSARQRQELIARVAAGIEQALASLDDGPELMKQAAILLKYGVERQVNVLEYWGESAKTQSELRPVVEAVIKLLDKAGAEAAKQAEELSNKLVGPGDPRGKTWEELEALANSAGYTRHMVDYYQIGRATV